MNMSQLQEFLNKIYPLEEKSGIHFDHPKFETFLQSVINGDVFDDLLPLDVKLSNGEDGIVVYLLTNARIIRIRITQKGFESSDIYLKEVTGINKELLSAEGEDKSVVRIESPQGYFGLRYQPGKKLVEDFFSKVESKVRESKKVS